MTHEIAAAFIIGGFIVMNKANVTVADWWRGLALVLIASAFALGLH